MADPAVFFSQVEGKVQADVDFIAESLSDKTLVAVIRRFTIDGDKNRAMVYYDALKKRVGEKEAAELIENDLQKLKEA